MPENRGHRRPLICLGKSTYYVSNVPFPAIRIGRLLKKSFDFKGFGLVEKDFNGILEKL